jgi:hypothetical protein
MHHSSNHPPTHPPSQPRKGHGNGRKVSQRGMLSVVMLLVSVGALGFAMLGGARMVFDILSEGSNNTGIAAKVIVVGLAYGVGWLTAMVAIRVYGNLVLPLLIKWFIFGSVAAVCFLYIQILQRLFDQQYDLWKFLKYATVMGAGLGAMVGLHLILEDHNLRPYAIPLLLISLIQLGLIVYRYVFTTTARPIFLLGDLTFFFGMAAFSTFMLAHIGILNPLRIRLTNYFDRNSTSIRTQD